MGAGARSASRAVRQLGQSGDQRSLGPGKDNGVANTNIIWHAGRLFALEESQRPFALDPETLAAQGYWDFGGAFTGTRFTAHPKVDPETGEMVFFAYSAVGPFTRTLSYGVIDKTGKLCRFDHFDAPYASMVHDFMVTRNYVLFPVLPLTGSMQRAMSGKPAYAWEPGKRSYVGVMKRNANVSSVHWFECDPCYVFHPMNAYEDGDKIVGDVMQYDAAPLFPDADGRPGEPAKAVASLTRWTFDLRRTPMGSSASRSTILPASFRASTNARPVWTIAMASSQRAAIGCLPIISTRWRMLISDQQAIRISITQRRCPVGTDLCTT